MAIFNGSASLSILGIFYVIFFSILGIIFFLSLFKSLSFLGIFKVFKSFKNGLDLLWIGCVCLFSPKGMLIEVIMETLSSSISMLSSKEKVGGDGTLSDTESVWLHSPC